MKQQRIHYLYKITPIHFKILIVYIVAFLFNACSNNEKIERLTIQKGKFRGSISETGELQAVNAYTIMSPDFRRFGRLMITYLVEHGKEVKKGDLVVSLDPASIMSYIVDRETRLEKDLADLKKMEAQHASRLASLQADLNSTLANFEMKKLELEKFQFESEKKKKMKELEFQQAQIRLDNLKIKMENEKTIMQNEKRIQQIRIMGRKDDLKKAYEAKKDLNLYSESNGVVQIRESWSTDQMLKVGDEIWRGMPLVSIPDLSEMKVITQVNETDISKVKKGQKVVVRLDAYPDKPFDGEISDIGLLSHQKEWDSDVKVFDIAVKMLESDPALKPGMTVSCEFVYADEQEAFYVPNECLERSKGSYYLYKETLAGYEQQKVNIGARNNTHTIILGNFKEGAKLIPVAEIKENSDDNNM